MRFIQRCTLVLAAVLVLSGCIKLDQTLSIKPDGSGTLDMRYGMSEQTIAQLEAMEQMAAGMKQPGMEMQVETDSPLDFDEADIRKKFAEEKPEGVELLGVSSETRDGWRYMDLKLAFDDLDALKKTDFFEDSGLSISKNADGNYVLVQTLGSDEMQMPGAGGAAAAGGPEMDEKMMQGMAAMLAGMRIAMTFDVPGEVLESNATKVDGNRASWVYDIDKDPTVLSNLEGQGPLRLVFSGEGLDL